VNHNGNWMERRLSELEAKVLREIFACRNEQAVEAAITFARYLVSLGLTPENFPVFLRILEIENHAVIDALVGNQDPFQMLSAVQPRDILVKHIFDMLGRWHAGGIYAKNLSVILGVLRSVYSAPRDGYRIYALSLAELNALGKHLDKRLGQDDPVNRTILDCLDRLSRLASDEDPDLDRIGVQAAAIRNAFFDDARKMEDVIPKVLIETKRTFEQVAPRQEKPTSGRPPSSK